MAKKGKRKAEEEGVLQVSTNRNARRLYEITSSLEAGIVLLGSEVKSIRAGGLNFKDSYVREKRGELFLVDCHIAPYSHSRVDSHKPERERKLLLHKQEIERLLAQIGKKGLTIVPLRMYFKSGRCKLEIGVGRGKKLHDKREDLKKAEAIRDIERAIRRNG